jgi:hypothetical protein
MPWDAISAIAAVIQALVVVIAAWIALYQWREALATRRLQGSERTIEAFQSPSIRISRDFLRNRRQDIARITSREDCLRLLDDLLKEAKTQGEGPGSLADLRRDLAVLEFVAVLSLNQMIPPSLEQAYLAPTLLQYWRDAETIVPAMRQSPGNELYLQHLEGLVELVVQSDFYVGSRARRLKAAKRKELIQRSRRAAMGSASPAR